MIPRIKVRTKVLYLINANVLGKNQLDENNSSVSVLWKNLSTAFLKKKQTNKQTTTQYIQHDYSLSKSLTISCKISYAEENSKESA